MNTEFARAALQDQKQRAPRAAAKAVAADPMHRSLEVNGDVVPVGEFFGDAPVARRIVLFEIIQRRVGEHHAETEGVIGAVALIHRDLSLRALLLEKDRRIQAGGSATDDRDLHETSGRDRSRVIILSLK